MTLAAEPNQSKAIMINSQSVTIRKSEAGECASRLELHFRGMIVAAWYPLAVLLYKIDTDVHHALIDLIAKTIMLGGILLIGQLFVVPCFNAKRIGLLWYTITIPIVLILWVLGIPAGIR